MEIACQLNENRFKHSYSIYIRDNMLNNPYISFAKTDGMKKIVHFLTFGPLCLNF